LALSAGGAASMIGVAVAQDAARTAPPFKIDVAPRVLMPAQPNGWHGDAEQRAGKEGARGRLGSSLPPLPGECPNLASPAVDQLVV
jgi:hypothetical protein